jgi:hypothetical protein
MQGLNMRGVLKGRGNSVSIFEVISLCIVPKSIKYVVWHKLSRHIEGIFKMLAYFLKFLIAAFSV